MTESWQDMVTSNKGRGYAFRNEVILYLRDNGFPAARRPPETKSLNYREWVANNCGDILGLPITVNVSAAKSLDISGHLDVAAQQAARAGNELYACISARRARSIEDSYCSMPLSVFVRVLEALYSNEVKS